MAATSAATIGESVAKASSGDLSLDESLRVFAFELARHVQRLPRDLVAKVTMSVVGGIGHLGEDRPDDAADEQSFTRQLQTIFDAGQDEIEPGTDRVELSAIASGMVIEGILRWSFGTTKHRSLEDVINERMVLILHGARRS